MTQPTRVLLTDICSPKQWPTITQDALVDSGYPVFGANGRIGYYHEYNHEDATILVTCRGATCGTVNVCAPRSYVTGNAMALDELDTERADIRYLFHALVHRGFRDAITGSAQPQITRQGLSAIEVPLPPLPEQKRIAAILDKADAIRRKRQQAIRLTEELLRSAFLDMFGDPVTNPKGWEVKKLGQIAASIPHAMAIGPFGSNLKTTDYAETGVPVVFIRDIVTGEYIPKSQVFVAETKAAELAAHTALPGDVLVTKMGTPPGIAAVYPTGHPPAVITADIIKVSPNTAIATPEYLADAINSKGVRSQVRKITNGVTRAKVTLRDFRQLSIVVPPRSEQARWSNLCRQMERQRDRLLNALGQSEKLGSSLMQRAFSGEL